jgi:hypothetical protein
MMSAWWLMIGLVGFTTVGGLMLAVGLHTASMLAIMACIAWVVYRKLGLAVLRKSWINFDLIWAVALLTVGGISLYQAFV